MPIPIEVILGSGGLAAFAIWVVNELWKAHKASDAREQKRADDAEARLAAFIGRLEQAPRDEP